MVNLLFYKNIKGFRRKLRLPVCSVSITCKIRLTDYEFAQQMNNLYIDAHFETCFCVSMS